MIIDIADLTIDALGDPHLGRQFIHGVPLARRGERETMVWKQFRTSLEQTTADVHVCMGDLFDKPIVSYDVIMRAAAEYLKVAKAKPDTDFIILKGNHDWQRDLERPSAFDLFSQIVGGVKNIIVVNDYLQYQNVLDFFAWSPTTPAWEAVRPESAAVAAFGHWDVEDFGGNNLNLIPTEELSEAGIYMAFTGHVHHPDQFEQDGVDVVVVGSMQPYAHGEETNEDLYITITPDDLPGDFHDRCVRVRLGPGEVLDQEIDCLQLTVQRITEQDEEEAPEVTLGDFDLESLFRKSCEEAGCPTDLTDRLLGKYAELRLANAG